MAENPIAELPDRGRSTPPAPRYRFADLELDTGRRRLSRGDTVIPLGHLTYRLLAALLEDAPNVVTHDRIVAAVWDGRSTSTETITQRVKLLRDALGDSADNPRYVRVLRNQGYQLIPPVERLAERPADVALPAAASYEQLPPDDSAGTLPASPAPPTASPAAATASRSAWLSRPLGASLLVTGAVALALALVAFLRDGDATREPLPVPAPVSIAVLPLDDLSGDPEQEYFVDGMTEALITSLARLSGLNVMSRRSILRYKNIDTPVPEIARELGVTTIVEGSAQLVDEQVRITVQLIDGATDRHLWAASYDRPFADVLRLQNELAQTVANEIKVTVSAAERERLAAARTVNPETYRAYLRGMYYLNKGTPEDLETGIAYMRKAVDRDPGDALAYAGLALGYVTLGHGAEPRADVWPLARVAAERAIALDPDLPEAHAALGDVKLYLLWDWEGAERAFLRANELSPSMATNHYHYAWYLALFGRWEEAIAAHRRAQQLDPLEPLPTLWLGGLYLYQDLGRHAEALAEAQRALELQPDNPSALMVLGWAQSAAGNHDLAIATHERMVELNPDLEWQLGLTYARAGRKDDARAILMGLKKRPTTSWTAYGQATLHAHLGEIDEAFGYLAFEPHHAWLPWVRQDPWLRPLIENDPRFDHLMRRLGLPR